MSASPYYIVGGHYENKDPFPESPLSEKLNNIYQKDHGEIMSDINSGVKK
jgi:hypothetical protein